MDACIFCKIAAKQLPSDIIYEDEDLVAFLDIRPISRGHTLVVPKAHVERYGDLSDAAASELARVLKVLAPRIMRAVGAQGFNLGLNNGSVAGQIISHVHWHIIPRYERDGLVHWPNRSADAGELRGTAESIRGVL